MNENAKVEEAEFFLGKVKAANDEREFIFYFSALTTAARSALTYALDDFRANGDNVAETWFNAQMNASAVLRLARDIRNVNVHETPLVMAGATAQTSFGAGAFVGIAPPTGGAPVTARLVPPGATVTSVRIDLSSAVPSWTGPTDVLTLSQLIFDAVDAFVAEGTKLGHLRFP